jgi:hypothetical protein
MNQSCEPNQSYKNCILNKVAQVINVKGSSRDYTKSNNNNACSGTESLNKKAFLSFLGSERFKNNDSNFVSLDELQKQKTYEILNQYDNDLKLTARYLNMSLSTLRTKLNKWKSQDESNLIKDEPASPNPSRRFFENIGNTWNIVSFSSRLREVCIEIKKPHGTSLVYQKLPNLKY